MLILNSKFFSACLLSFSIISSNAGLFANDVNEEIQSEADISKRCCQEREKVQRCCGKGATGATGAVGVTGLTGTNGQTGVFGGEFADFYALMPGDNNSQVAIGAPVQFPQDGPASGSITRLNATDFALTNVGTYYITFQVSVTEAGQLVLTLNGTEIASTVVGRATGANHIYGTAIVTTTGPGDILSVNNPAGNPAALGITPFAGGASAVSAHLVIMRIL